MFFPTSFLPELDVMNYCAFNLDHIGIVSYSAGYNILDLLFRFVLNGYF